jgi:hypothetical protein
MAVRGEINFLRLMPVVEPPPIINTTANLVRTDLISGHEALILCSIKK